MATATFYIENNSAYTFNQSSTFYACTDATSSPTQKYYTTPTNTTSNKVFPTSSIPTGSTINSALLYATVDKGTYSGTALHGAIGGTNSSTLNGLDIKAYVSAGSDVTVQYYWKSSTGGSYPTEVANQYVQTQKTGTASWSSIRLDVDYTPPYAAKVWNGSSWVSGTPHVWNGSTWVPGTAYVWNGSAWVPGLT